MLTILTVLVALSLLLNLAGFFVLMAMGEELRKHTALLNERLAMEKARAQTIQRYSRGRDLLRERLATRAN